MDSGDESDDEPMYTEMLEEVPDGSKSCLNVISSESSYKIRDHIKQRQSEWKGTLLSTWNMGKGLRKAFKTFVEEISPDLRPLGESGS